jgi:hypothetical protein
MSDTHFKVINGGQDTSPEEAKPQGWSETVRSDAKALAGKLDEGYMELAKILYTIWDSPIGGDKINAPIFTQWGYTTFSDYVEMELNIHRKKAQRLKSIWYTLEVQLAGTLDPNLKKRIVALGFSKVRELVGVLTARNASKWVELAEGLSYPKLCISVRKYREDRKNLEESQAAAKEAGLVTEGSIDDLADEHSEGGAGSGTDGGEYDGLPQAVDSVIGEPLYAEEPQVPDASYSDMAKEYFSLYPEQHDTVKEALAIAQKLSNSTVKSNNLHLICLDFVATNGEGKTTAQQRMKRLVQLAKSYGLDLVILDDGDVVFGYENLEALAAKADV